ncbi:MAG: hypothetical protein H6731_03170 [Myxococcales bacterium]|nr:MAG: hypothetical protein H6731_03170 [Myxococcales bacterium]
MNYFFLLFTLLVFQFELHAKKNTPKSAYNYEESEEDPQAPIIPSSEHEDEAMEVHTPKKSSVVLRNSRPYMLESSRRRSTPPTGRERRNALPYIFPKEFSRAHLPNELDEPIREQP